MEAEINEALRKQQNVKNKQYLSLFETSLKNSNMSDKTIKNHLANVDIYINTFLLYREPLSMPEGCGKQLDSYLDDFFVRQCVWSSPAAVKSTAASIKKFYKCMLEHGYVTKIDYGCLVDLMKDNMTLWQEQY